MKEKVLLKGWHSQQNGACTKKQSGENPKTDHNGGGKERHPGSEAEEKSSGSVELDEGLEGGGDLAAERNLSRPDRTRRQACQAHESQRLHFPA